MWKVWKPFFTPSQTDNITLHPTNTIQLYLQPETKILYLFLLKESVSDVVLSLKLLLVTQSVCFASWLFNSNASHRKHQFCLEELKMFLKPAG